MRIKTNSLAGAVALAMLFLTVQPSSAQNGINTPYSRYGLGVLSDQSVGHLKSMGGVGTGYRDRNVINLKNPASYSMVDTLTFMADLGFSLSYSNFQENGTTVNAGNAAVDHFAMQFRVLPRVGMTIAFLPFSNAGYDFSSSQLVRRDMDGEVTTTSYNVGTGGLRQFMGGLGWRPSEWLSVGANASFLKGDLTHSVQSISSSSNVTSRTLTRSTSMSALKLDLGVQTTIKTGKSANDRLVLGAVWSRFEGIDDNTTESDVHTTGDTISLTNAFALPDELAFGFSYFWKNKSIAADVAYENWSAARFFGQEYGLDRIKASAGFRICPDATSKNLFARSSYQAGVSFAQPYYMVGDAKGPLEMGVRAGISFPVSSSYNSMAYVHVSGSYQRIQPQCSGMISENCMMLSVAVSFMETWFQKWLVD